ncbi:histone deacetylase complex subunit SAP30 Sin3-binding protein [Trifolium pratense]|uniref:Histone deacetylase complex subunit SAP30 Sin3-binding protein n=1 Tax=Trifolium pratense TaxID=57577 RepID=A0A2K3LCP0_TRIPR|nr:histone deacetylase complex subunit SAP30 Sin3-binding protein [Trifolium pratense]
MIILHCFTCIKLQVLTNGIEVKLQRNALSVIEPPTGNEEDDDLEFENENTIWHGSDMASDDTQKSNKSRNRMQRSLGSSHKSISRSFSVDSQSKGSISMPHAWTKVDLSKLEMSALWRYWRHFNLVDAVPNPSKEQLVDVVQRHFMSQFQLDLDFMQSLIPRIHEVNTLDLNPTTTNVLNVLMHGIVTSGSLNLLNYE